MRDILQIAIETILAILAEIIVIAIGVFVYIAYQLTHCPRCKRKLRIIKSRDDIYRECSNPNCVVGEVKLMIY